MTAKADSEEQARVGVYVCHCGLNIAGTVDCAKVRDFAASLPNVVVSRDNRYMCADQGQELIKKDIKELGINRVVVASCSPRMHEPTFRTCVNGAGLNPYLFEMANIREHCSWCHTSNPEEATEKAKDLVRMAVAKARHLRDLHVIEVPVTNRALVIGGGVAGIHSALDLADHGFHVYLVDRDASIGGRMAQLDKTFPTLDCSICILGPKMVEASRHPNIELLTYAEVKKAEGYIGNFKVTLLKKPRYVISEKCNACGDCTKVCPVEVPNEFDEGLSWRKAIHVPFPQAVPASYVLDEKSCLGLVPLTCAKCKEACERGAIDYDMHPVEEAIEVGTIVVATGFDLYDSAMMKEYGFGEYSNVITSLELERLINAAGPTNGHVVRPSDLKEPHKVAFIQCVGSRDEKEKPYCSGFCCMYTIKNAVLLKEHYPDMDITVYFIDIRAPFKGYEEFYRRARIQGIKFIRGKPSEIGENPTNKNLIISVEDVSAGERRDAEYDMAILSPAAVPRSGTEELGRTLNITRDSSGFFMEYHPKLRPMDTPTDGIFLSGCAQGPKDIPYSVAQASGAAARASRILSKAKWSIEPTVAWVMPELCRNTTTKCGICATRCPYGAITAEEKKAALVTPAKCHGCGTCVADCPSNAITQLGFTDLQITSQIASALAIEPEKKILAFLCNWCSYAGADLAGTSRRQYPPNVRAIKVMCSGRVDREFIFEAFRRGAGMVLVSGCHPYDCHYISGNFHCEKRVKAIPPLLEKIGISPERLRLEWVSAAEGDRYAKIISEMSETVNKMGVEHVRKENSAAMQYLDKMTDSRYRQIVG